MNKILRYLSLFTLISCRDQQSELQHKFYVVKHEHGKSDTLCVNHIPESSDRMVAVDSFDYTIHQKSIRILKFTNPDAGIDSKVEAYFEKSLGIFLVKNKTWSLNYQLRSTDDSVEACIDKIQHLDFVK